LGDHPRGHEAGERLYVAGDTVVHRVPAHVKLLSAVATVLVVVATPGQMFAVFAGYAAILAALVRLARIPVRTVATRMVIEVPFVIFAALMPLVAVGPRIDVGPLSLSEAGLLAAWTLVAKATAGVVVSIVLGATTTTSDMIAGLRRLRLPDLLVQILAGMVRYVHVVGEEVHRMARAREARGFAARGPRAWPVLARSLGTLFIRSYERGERVHLAMQSRGYTGRMPQLHPAPPPTAGMWASASVLPAAAAAVLVAGLASGGAA
jgi:cobalt/nickel transport system permease protein